MSCTVLIISYLLLPQVSSEFSVASSSLQLMPPFIASCTIVLLLDLVLPALLLFSSIHSLQDPHWPQSPQAQSIGLAAGAGVVPAVNQLDIMNIIYKSKMSLNLAQSSNDSTDNCLPLVLSMAPWIYLPFGNRSNTRCVSDEETNDNDNSYLCIHGHISSLH